VETLRAEGHSVNRKRVQRLASTPASVLLYLDLTVIMEFCRDDDAIIKMSRFVQIFAHVARHSQQIVIYLLDVARTRMLDFVPDSPQ
jgi:hypothetical protein